MARTYYCRRENKWKPSACRKLLSETQVSHPDPKEVHTAFIYACECGHEMKEEKYPNALMDFFSITKKRS